MSINKTVAQYIAELIHKSDKSVAQIAQEAGFASENSLRMIAEGKIKLPLERVENLAMTFNTDPADLMHRVLREYTPGIGDAIQRCLGVPSHNERILLELLRTETGGRDPLLVTTSNRSAVEHLCRALLAISPSNVEVSSR